MYPTLFYIGNFAVKTYWIMVFAGIIAGFAALYLNLLSVNKHKRNKILLFAAFIFIPFYFGARLGYITEALIYDKKIFFDLFSISGPYALIWGLLTAIAFSFPLSKIFKVDVLEVSDFFSPSIALGGFFAKLGCLFNGCCFGIPCGQDFPLATHFSTFSNAGHFYPGIPLYPVQLFESITWLAVFIILNLRQKNKKYTGELIIIMAYIYCSSRFFIEFIRFHEKAQALSSTQILCIVILVIALILNKFFKNIKTTGILTKNLTK